MSRTRSCRVSGAIWAGICLVPIALLSSEAPAQQAAEASPELVQAILRNAYRFEGGNVRLLNGRVPEDIANFYVPPGTRVLGSVVYGSSVRVFATTSTPGDSLRELYARALAPSGWRPFSWGAPRGGFVDSRRDMPIIFCRDGAQLQIQRAPAAPGTQDLVLDFRDGMGPCDQPAAMGSMTATATAVRASPGAVFMEGSRWDLRFPTLQSPDDVSPSARTRCYSRSGSASDMSTGTMVPSTMTAAELLRHYAKQLEDQGWRSSAAAGRQAAAGTWRLADTSGVKEVTLQVVESGRTAAACFDVQMRMSERPR